MPLIVITLVAQCADTPAGNPLAPATLSLEIAVAPVVAMVILVNAVLIHSVGVDDGAPAVLFGVTVIVVFAEGEFIMPFPSVTVSE